MARPQLNTTVLDFANAEAGTFIVDCPRALSLYNRRAYRSGYVYSVDYIEYIGSAGDTIQISKIPENYNTLGAYKLGFHVWRQQRAEAIDESGIEPGRWSDFKPWMCIEHTTGAFPELAPEGMNATLVLEALDQTGSEWDRADIAIHNLDPTGGVTTTSVLPVGMLGEDSGSIYGGLIHAWGETRRQTLSPDPLLFEDADISWITRTGEASAAMSSDVLELIDTENDVPPYANQADTTKAPTYVGNGESAMRGVLVDTSVAGSTGRSVGLSGGLVPLGLLALKTTGGPFVLRVHMSRGPYKGVAAMSMGSFS